MIIVRFAFLIFVIFLLDYLWMTYCMGDFYKSRLSHLIELEEGRWSFKTKLLPVLYLLMSFGLFYFVLSVASTPVEALVKGALWGLVLYGVYETTNYTLLREWPLSVVVVDTFWGASLGAIVSYLYSLVFALKLS